MENKIISIMAYWSLIDFWLLIIWSIYGRYRVNIQICYNIKLTCGWTNVIAAAMYLHPLIESANFDSWSRSSRFGFGRSPRSVQPVSWVPYTRCMDVCRLGCSPIYNYLECCFFWACLRSPHSRWLRIQRAIPISPCKPPLGLRTGLQACSRK